MRRDGEHTLQRAQRFNYSPFQNPNQVFLTVGARPEARKGVAKGILIFSGGPSGS